MKENNLRSYSHVTDLAIIDVALLGRLSATGTFHQTLEMLFFLWYLGLNSGPYIY
jgi:hypothetical protein